MLYRYLLLPLLLFILVLSSCSSKMSLTKRRYMKGYHMDFAKNRTNKPEPTKEQVSVLKKFASPKIISSQQEELYACKTEKIALNKVNYTSAAFVKNKKYKALGSNSLNTSLNKAKINKHNLLNTLNKNKIRLTKAVRTKDANKHQWPIDFFWNNNGSNNFGMGLVYVLGGLIVLSFVYLVIAFLFSAVIYSAVFPSWLIGLLLLIGIMVLAAIIFVVVVNGD